MQMILMVALICTAGFSWALEAPVPTAAWLQERAAVRKMRTAIEQGAADDRVDRATRAAQVVADLMVKAKEMGIGRDDVDLAHLVTGVGFLDAATGAPLTTTWSGLPEKSTTDAKQIKAWQQLL